MPMVTDLLSGYVKAEDLEVGVKVEALIVDTKRQDFAEKNGEMSTKIVLIFEDGQQVVLNKTRLKSMVRGFGPNSDNWINKKILISRGTTTYAGDDVPCIRIEPIVATRIAPPKGRGKATITSGRKSTPASEDAEPIDVDDEIPF